MIVDKLASLQSASPAGFAIALHIRFMAPSLLLQTYPKSWTDHYSQMGLVMSDPTVAWGFENEGSVRWSQLTDQDTNGVLAQAADHGLRFGLTCVAANADSRSIAGFTRPDREFTDQEIASLVMQTKSLHDQTSAETVLPPDAVNKLHKMQIRLIKSVD